MTLNELIDRLTAVDPTAAPFISLYENTQPDETGRENYDSFLRKQFQEITGTFPAHSPEYDNLTRDVERIKTYPTDEVRPGTVPDRNTSVATRAPQPSGSEETNQPGNASALN